MCRALSIVGSYAKCQFAGDFGVTVGHNEHSLHNPYTQIDAVKCQSNAKGMHFLEIVGLLRTPPCKENAAANIPPAPLKVQLHENTKSNLCWCQHDHLKTHTSEWGFIHTTFQSCSRNRVKTLCMMTVEYMNTNMFEWIQVVLC